MSSDVSLLLFERRFSEQLQPTATLVVRSGDDRLHAPLSSLVLHHGRFCHLRGGLSLPGVSQKQKTIGGLWNRITIFSLCSPGKEF